MHVSPTAQTQIVRSTESLQTLNCNLSPIIHSEWHSFLEENQSRIHSLLEQYGSPLHLVAPQVLAANLAKIEAAIQSHGVKAQVYYAMKANKGRGLVSTAAASGFGIDVASEYEFKLACELSPLHTPLSLSGPVKPTSLFQAAIERNVNISIDSVEELRALRDHVMSHRSQNPARIYLRYRPSFKAKTRFGMSTEDVMACTRILTEFRLLIEFIGFHMHLSGYSAIERGRSVAELVGLSEVLDTHGLKTQFINIGGGMPVQYVAPDAFETFMELHQGSAVEYKGGQPSWFYPYGGRLTLEAWMREFMDYFLAPGLKIADWLRRCDITLAVEPGRSALDQVAISLFSVGLVKDRGSFSTVFLNGSSFSASETWFQSDYLCDPILLRFGPRGRAPIKTTPAYYLAGHSCLEDDIIAYRPFSGDVAIASGDALAFINTGGYHMDLLENNFHHHPTPARLNIDFSNLTFTQECAK